MAFGGFNQAEDAPKAEINMIPLIDVMLVMLVIFIITAPIMTHTVEIEMPKASSTPTPKEAPLPPVTIAIDAQGALYWDNEPLSEARLGERLRGGVAAKPELAIHIRADRQVAYDAVAKVMAQAQQAGVTRIGFVTQPEVTQ